MGDKVVYLVLKSDALIRNISDDIIDYLVTYFHLSLLPAFKITLTIDDVMKIKKEEFETKWAEYPNDFILSLVTKYEANEVLVVPCLYENNDIFSKLKLIKGNTHIPYFCNHDSVRFKFRDKKQISRLVEYDDEILLEKYGKNEFSFPATVMHTPDSEKENDILKKIIMEKRI